MKDSTSFHLKSLFITSMPARLRFSVILFCFFISITYVMSQATFNILPSNTITDTLGCGTSGKTFKIYISNPSSKDLRLSYTVLSNTMPDVACWEYMFCDWENCYLTLPIGTITPDTSLIIPANNQNCTGTTEKCSMYMTITVGNKKGQGSYVIKIFETNNPANSQTVTWNIGGCLTGTDCSAGIFEPADNTGIVVFPNPAKEHITVEITKGYQPGSSIQVYNMVGEKLIEYSEVKNSLIKIDLTTLPLGGYFVKYNYRDGISVKKFFKTN